MIRLNRKEMIRIAESHRNRGLEFEAIISDKCKKYIKDKHAYILKVPTDWQVLRKGAKLVSAFPKKKSICDFLGVLSDGRAIALEAKRIASSTTSFPFSNIGDHQFKFFQKWKECGGLGYYIIYWKALDKCYLVTSEKIQDAKDNIGRKSIPYDWFTNEENCAEVIDFEFLDYIEKE